jgi:hypothetical protein
LDTDKIEASYGDGVLHLDIPTAQVARPRRVQVRTDSSGQRQVTVEGETVEGETAESASASPETSDTGSQGSDT